MVLVSIRLVVLVAIRLVVIWRWCSACCWRWGSGGWWRWGSAAEAFGGGGIAERTTHIWEWWWLLEGWGKGGGGGVPASGVVATGVAHSRRWGIGTRKKGC